VTLSSQMKRLISAVFVILILAGISRLRTAGVFLEGPSQLLHHQGETMGSYFAYTYLPPTRNFDSAEQIVLNHSIQEVLKEFDYKLSTYRPDSPVSLFNRARTRRWLDVPRELIQLLELAAEIRAQGEGVLDLTIAPLAKVWGFGSAAKRSEPPGEIEISRARALVGQQKLRVDSKKNRIAKSQVAMEVDINAIASGYAADLIGEMLEVRGIRNYMVDIGGEIRARGEKKPGQGWVIGIETPADTYAKGVEAKVELKNLSLATSGNYRNYFEKDGVRYSHILDPRTGYPISHRLASVTVLDTKAARADAWATTILVLGPERGMQVAQREGLGVMMLLARESGGFEVRMTPEFKKRTLTSKE
jgi:thiamine biosynthesis lipoprotein